MDEDLSWAVACEVHHSLDRRQPPEAEVQRTPSKSNQDAPGKPKAWVISFVPDQDFNLTSRVLSLQGG